MSVRLGSLATWNTAPAQDAEADLRTCCASATWARRVAAGRPYPDIEAVQAAAAAELAALDWPDVAEALAAHPRIGERVAGAGRESEWSRREQAGAQQAGASTADALVEANRAYEDKFGHVFLIFATGRSATEMLAAAHDRLGNDPQTEQGVVRGELAKITRLRLQRLLDQDEA